MVLGERRAVGQRAAVHRRADLLRKRHACIPGAAAIDFRAEDQSRSLRTVDALGESAQALGIRADAVTDRADHRGPQRRFLPVVKRDRQIHRAGRRLQRDRVGAHERRRHVLGAGGLIGPFHPRLRKHSLVRVAQIRFTQHHFTRLLAGRDNQWDVALVGGHQAAHRVSGPRSSVHIDQGGLARRLGEPVSHRHHRGLLQPQNIGEVVGEVLQKRLLGGTGVTEHRGQSQRTKQIVGHLVDGLLISHCPAGPLIC